MRGYVIITGILLLGAIFVLARGQLDGVPPPPAEPRRIVSLSPGITESLYALGLGDRVAGVTRFCAWPPEAADKPKVAGFREVNLEAVARVQPDLVVLPDDMAHFKNSIENLGIPALTFEGRTLSGFLRDLERLGAVCGAAAKARGITDSFDEAVARARLESRGFKRPRVLFALMNPDECSRPISELNILGNDGFYSELIAAAGGVNAYAGKIPYPRLSREAIMALNPDVIVAAAPACPDLAGLRSEWLSLANVRAIEGDNLLLLNDPGDTIPGPRSLRTLARLAWAIGKAVAASIAEKEAGK